MTEGTYSEATSIHVGITNSNSEERTKDMCPICKTDKYLSPNMTFLINPECYHKICESCVDRIFSLGPAPCPYPGCGKILRKNKFKKQVFDDLGIEKEIDIRKRVSKIFNKTQEDFDNLDDYNKYLEDVENIVFKLNNGIDLEETEAYLTKYQNEHKLEVIEKNLLESQKNQDFAKYQESLAHLKEEKLRIRRQMELEDLDYQKKQKQELLDKLSNTEGATSEQLLAQANNQMLKRTSLRKKQLQMLTSQLDQHFQLNNPYNKKQNEKPATPFTPFMGDRDMHKKYYLLAIPDDVFLSENPQKLMETTYYDPHMLKLAKDKQFVGAGWRLNDVYQRSLDEAFMGLDCYIEEEKA